LSVSRARASALLRSSARFYSSACSTRGRFPARHRWDRDCAKTCGFGLSTVQLLHWIVMRVELLGLPRERAGVAELELEADTLGQLLTALAVRFPSFGELIT